MKYYLHIQTGIAIPYHKISSTVNSYPNSFVEIRKNEFEKIKTEAGWSEKDLRKLRGIHASSVINITFDRRNHFSNANNEKLEKKGIILFFPNVKSSKRKPIPWN